MFRDKIGLTGSVRVQVFGSDGNLKRFPEHPVLKYAPLSIQELAERWFGIPVSGREVDVVNHNIVTNEGDALIADLLQETPERTKLDNANAVIGVGTGFASEAKTVDALVTQTGSSEAMDAGYPQTKGAWSAANDNVIVYLSSFEAGDLNDTGIDEALLGNGTDTMAYAEISPAVDVSTSDSLQVTWEITLLGS